MSDVEKIIKYCAIAFAIFLAFSIISLIAFGISSVSSIFSNDDIVDLKILDIDNFESLNIDVSSVNVIIKENSSFKIETNNKYINTKKENNKLSITEKKHNWFNRDNTDLIIYIPTDSVLNSINIESGAGKVNINNVKTKKIDLNLGAGKVDIDNLLVLDETKIEGGAGEININNSNLNDLDLDMGIGSLNLTAKISGNSEIDAGVGEININLIGNDYKIKIDKGIGTATINEKSVMYYGNGSSIIDIDGGVGSIKIKVEDFNE